MKNLSKSTVEALTTIVMNEGRPFYAADYDISGGVINGLYYSGIICPTGKTRKVFVPLHEKRHGNEVYMQVEAMEWELSRVGVKALADEVREQAHAMVHLSNYLEVLL